MLDADQAAIAHDADGSVDQQAHHRGGCSLNSIADGSREVTTYPAKAYSDALRQKRFRRSS